MVGRGGPTGRENQALTVLVEGCVDSLATALAAERGGASRLELCANLDVGGTTPGEELVRAVLSAVQIPVIAMARPRGGSFVHSPEEVAAIVSDAARLRAQGVAGVVFGVLRPDGALDGDAIQRVASAADGCELVMHRAFDHARDLSEALDTLMDGGVHRVLTGGGPATAQEGVAMLQRLVRQAGQRIQILAGGKVRPANVGAIVRESGVRQVHARCGTDEAMVRALVAAAN